MEPRGFSAQQCVGEKVRESPARCSRSSLYSTALPPAEQAEAAWKVSAWGACGINLDLQSLPPWVSPPCFLSCCFAKETVAGNK